MKSYQLLKLAIALKYAKDQNTRLSYGASSVVNFTSTVFNPRQFFIVSLQLLYKHSCESLLCRWRLFAISITLVTLAYGGTRAWAHNL